MSENKHTAQETITDIKNLIKAAQSDEYLHHVETMYSALDLITYLQVRCDPLAGVGDVAEFMANLNHKLRDIECICPTPRERFPNIICNRCEALALFPTTEESKPAQ